MICRIIILIILIIFPNLKVESKIPLRQKDRITMNSFIDSIVTNLDIIGLAVVITQDGEIIYENYSGYRSLPEMDKQSEKISVDNLFRIASISKTFIATVIMRLKEDGKLYLNDDAQKYLTFPLRNPEYPDIPITIKQLLTHTSSINDSQKYNSLDIINPNKNPYYSKSFSSTQPGKKYKYCNFNYNLLGAIIENITGKRFDEVVDEYILKPLSIEAGFDPNKMDASKFVSLYTFNKEKDKYVESIAAYKNYSSELKNYKLGVSTALLSPCGGMKITPRDLAKYMDMHINLGYVDSLRIITPESESLMKENYVGKGNYGYSYRQYKDLCPEHILSGQTGGAFGLKSAMIFDSKEKLGFVIISSGSKSKYIDGSGDIHFPLIKKFFSLISQ